MKFIPRFIAIVAAFTLLFAAYGGRVDPNVWTLPSMATLALPVVAVVALVIMALLFLFKQWRAAVIIMCAFFLSWPTLKLLTPLNFSRPEAHDDKIPLKVLTMNVTQFNWQKGNQPSQSMRYILDQNADVVVIQEGLLYFPYERIATVKPMLKELYKKYPYRKKEFFDVGILSKYPFTEVSSPILQQDTLGYFIKAWDVDAPGGQLRVVGIHLSSLRFTRNDSRILDSMNKPSGRKKRIRSVTDKLGTSFVSHARQAHAIRQLLDETIGDALVVGDMNDTPGSFAYRTVCGDDMRDTWVESAFGPTYTFNAHHLYVKIDHILYRGNMTLRSCWRDKAGDSDHYPLVAVFER